MTKRRKDPPWKQCRLHGEPSPIPPIPDLIETLRPSMYHDSNTELQLPRPKPEPIRMLDVDLLTLPRQDTIFEELSIIVCNTYLNDLTSRLRELETIILIGDISTAEQSIEDLEPVDEHIISPQDEEMLMAVLHMYLLRSRGNRRFPY